ncbi:MAG: hypothetical protein QOC89_3346 [Paraburkholderia sp.]|nr:hypothetical protein [Paraburkholderia sp.]
MTRFMLYASTCKLISVLTRSMVPVRKWVAPIHALIVPNGCSTVCRRMPYMRRPVVAEVKTSVSAAVLKSPG